MTRAAFSLALAFFLSACAASSADDSAPHEAASGRETAEMTATTLADTESALEGDEWYRNARFDFAVRLPVRLASPGACALPEPPPHGYEVLAFEDGDAVYLAPSVYGARVEKIPGDPSAGVDCVRINNTLPTIRKSLTDTGAYPYGWRMSGAEHIESDIDLLAFVRKHYGSSCALGAKTPTIYDGTFDVAVGGENCTLPGAYALKYSPVRKVAVTWTMEKDDRFDGLDAHMARTLRFE